MPAAKRAPTPNDATARYLRKYLKKAGVEHLVKRINTGKEHTIVRIDYGDEYDIDNEISAQKVAEALRPMWHDGDTRVRVIYGGAVTIDRKGWHRTMPNTAEGIAQLEIAENERNSQLLAALAEGHDVRATCYSKVEYQPDPAHPREPWVKTLSGNRCNPWAVHVYRTH